MDPSIFIELSIIIIFAASLAYLASLLRQPLIIGYILAGIIMGPSVLNVLQTTDTVAALSQLGVALLLFMVGLNLNPRILRDLGRVSLVAGIGQVAFTSSIGYAICRYLGLDTITSLYVAIALTFSSTIVILKLLSDKGDLHSLYGRVAIGIFLVQDIVAVLIIMAISTAATTTSLSSVLVTTLLGGVGLVALLGITTKYILPHIDGRLSRSIELLFLCSIAWCLAWASLFEFLGFSIEIGALFAGIALAMSEYGTQIAARIKPLRDFFLVLFFIILGSDMHLGMLTQQEINQAVFLSLFVLIGNPLVIMSIFRFLRFPRHAGFLCGLTVAQISEFSLILIALGIKVGHIQGSVMQLVTIIALATIGASSYMIIYGDKIYRRVSPHLHIFDPKHHNHHRAPSNNYSAILFGYNRIGYDLLPKMNKIRGKSLVIDYDPDVVKRLQADGIDCIYGDADDVTLTDEISLKKPKLFVSTIPNSDSTIHLIETIRKFNKRAVIIVIAHKIADALHFYEKGASYVLLPHFIGGKHAANLIKKHKSSKTAYNKEKKKHIKYLKARMLEGHEHPQHERP